MLNRSRSLALLLSLALTAGAVAQTPLPRLRTEGTKIVNPAGQPVFLRGVNLGNWLLIEPGVFSNAIGEFPDQHTLFKTLRDRFGEAERRRLIDLYRDHFITARDFDIAKQFGFNFVRVGFDYELLEDDERPMQLRADAFKYFDFTVKEAKARGMYVLFDLHGAQERQVSGKQGGHIGYAKFWKDPKAQERSLWMWTEIFKRYKGDTTVMGYEQLNEPFNAKPEELLDYSMRWYKALRAVDTDAIAVLHGLHDRAGQGIDFYPRPADAGMTNVVFDMHFYPGSFVRPTATQPVTPKVNTQFIQRSLPRWAERMKRFDAPLLVGEMNPVYKEVGGGEMTRRYYDFFQEQGWAVTFWTIKELSPKGGYHGRYWSLTTNATPIPPVDIRTSSAAEIEAAFRSLSTMPLENDSDTLHWLTTDATPSPLPRADSTGPTTAPTGEQPNATQPTTN